MKKVIQVGIAILLVVGITGCSPKVSEEAIDRYIEISKNAVNMKSADYNLAMKVNIDNQNLELNASGAYDASNDLKMNMMVETKEANATNTVLGNMYVENGIMYSDMLGEKQTISFDQYASMLNELMVTSNTSIDADAIKKVLKSAELKDEHLILTIDKEVYKEMIDKNFSQFQALGLSMTTSDIKMDITIADNFMSNIVMDFTLTAKIEGQATQSLKFHMAVGLTNINTDKTIPAPDLSEYPEAVQLPLGL